MIFGDSEIQGANQERRARFFHVLLKFWAPIWTPGRDKIIVKYDFRRLWNTRSRPGEPGTIFPFFFEIMGSNLDLWEGQVWDFFGDDLKHWSTSACGLHFHPIHNMFWTKSGTENHHKLRTKRNENASKRSLLKYQRMEPQDPWNLWFHMEGVTKITVSSNCQVSKPMSEKTQKIDQNSFKYRSGGGF